MIIWNKINNGYPIYGWNMSYHAIIGLITCFLMTVQII